jgi:hypothetical protein
MKTSQMQFGHYYVVDVSFGPTNPIHRAIAFNMQSGGNLLWLIRGGYEWGTQVHAIPVNLTHLSHLEVIEEITLMQSDSYRLPREGNEP